MSLSIVTNVPSPSSFSASIPSLQSTSTVNNVASLKAALVASQQAASQSPGLAALMKAVSLPIGEQTTNLANVTNTLASYDAPPDSNDAIDLSFTQLQTQLQAGATVLPTNSTPTQV